MFKEKEEDQKIIDKLYLDERDRLMAGTQPFPSPFFCEEFISRLEIGHKEADDNEIQGDSYDYMSWGYALFGYLEYAEQQVQDMNLWDWVHFYEAVNNKKLADAIESITEILEE